MPSSDTSMESVKYLTLVIDRHLTIYKTLDCCYDGDTGSLLCPFCRILPSFVSRCLVAGIARLLIAFPTRTKTKQKRNYATLLSQT